MEDHQRFMHIAYQEALKALDEGEVPVGAIIVRNRQIIGRGYNRIEGSGDATAHAEIIAISAATANSATWRLNECTIYITLEPCIMCLGAIMQSRISQIFYAAADPRYGALESRPYQSIIEQAYNWFPVVTSGLYREECSTLLKSFFADLRKKS